MDMPKPGPAHHLLEKLAGRWTGQEKISPSPFDPEGGAAIGRCDNRMALDGFVLVHDYEQERNGKVNFRGHGVFSFNPMEQCYYMHWFDSMGMGMNTFRGKFEGDVLKMQCDDPQGKSRATWQLNGNNKYSFSMEVSPDGKQWFPFMQGNYTKAG